MHAETEFCEDHSVCLCGIVILYGNDVYVYRTCGDTFLQGHIFGDGKYFSNIDDNVSCMCM